MSKVLVLRTNNPDLTSAYNGFQWPASGHVIAPDWDPIPECGFGLHGALWGVGDGWMFNWDPTAKWLVVEVEEGQIVDLNGKVKFPEGDVVFSGSRLDATQYLQARLPPGSYPVIGTTVIVGYEGTAIVGHGGTAIALDSGTAIAGEMGAVIAGEDGKAIAGEGGKAIAGRFGTATSGACGIAITGYNGTATTGRGGWAIACGQGTAIAGENGMAISEYKGDASAGECGIIQIQYWDGNRIRIQIGYIGEGGLEPNQSYKLDENHNFVQNDDKLST